MSYFFSLYWSLSSSSCTVFGAILSNIYEVLSINQSSKVFVFGELKVHQKDWIIYSGETDRPGKFCCNFSISNNLTQMVNSPTQIPDCESQPYSFKFIYMASDPVAVSISTDFPSISKGMTFHSQLMTVLGLTGTIFLIIWEMFNGRTSFLNLVLLQLLFNFVSGSMYELMHILSSTSGQTSLMSMILSCLCFCHSS